MPQFRSFRPLSAAALALTLCGCSVFGVRTAEEAPYTVIASDGAFEIRRYPALTVARTVVIGEDYDSAAGGGFRRLANYIFGANRRTEDIAMTAPVLMTPADGEKIAMTAPVTTEAFDQGLQMTFIMPAGHTRESLPRPDDERISIDVIPPRTVAVLRFSGRLDGGDAARADALRSWLADNGYRATSAPRLAGFDPPWTLPFLRRNEVQIDVTPNAVPPDDASPAPVTPTG